MSTVIHLTVHGDSIAECRAKTMTELERLTGRRMTHFDMSVWADGGTGLRAEISARVEMFPPAPAPPDPCVGRPTW